MDVSIFILPEIPYIIKGSSTFSTIVRCLSISSVVAYGNPKHFVHHVRIIEAFKRFLDCDMGILHRKAFCKYFNISFNLILNHYHRS